MSEQIDNVLHENRAFPPSKDFQSQARLNSFEQYQRMYAESLQDPEAFWGRVAQELPWIRPFDQVLDWSDAPFASWFQGGQLNASAICLDQHVANGRGDKLAIRWEGEPGDRRDFTYRELLEEVGRFANVLKARGVQRGDRVAIYMPMIPELTMAVLACARIGAVHSVVFGGFSAQALADRIHDGDCCAVITSDGGWRRGKVLPLKQEVDTALATCKGVHTQLVIRRCGNEVAWDEKRDVWYHEAAEQVGSDCPPEAMESEDLLFLLYTSGSTGKPKGIMHSTGGYMVGAYLSARYIFDLREDDVYWCTADVG
ncbi:MAG: AMP-binding protein, partial [Planctomycetes bacterium]|nr:AMP-binding protein [Planctomycetota bacterium]